MNQIKGIYLMLNCNNPATVCISRKRRDELKPVIQEYNLTVIEGDIYAGLPTDHLPSFYSMLPD